VMIFDKEEGSYECLCNGTACQGESCGRNAGLITLNYETISTILGECVKTEPLPEEKPKPKKHKKTPMPTSNKRRDKKWGQR